MPFQSEKQRRYLWANEPEIARDWSKKYGSRVRKVNGGIMESLQNMNLRDVGLYGGAGLGALGAGAGWQSMQDINAINKMAASGNYGVGNKMPQAFMDKLKGAYTPSSVFKKTGYPTGLKNWFFSRSSPGHFGPVEKAMKIGKAASKYLPRLLSKAALPLELLRATPANADEVNMTEQDWENLRSGNKSPQNNYKEEFKSLYDQGTYDNFSLAMDDAERYAKGEKTNHEKLTGYNPITDIYDRDYTAGEHYNMTPDAKTRAMRQDLKSVPDHTRRQTNFPTSTAQQFANLGQPHKGFEQSGADLDKWGNRRMAQEKLNQYPQKKGLGEGITAAWNSLKESPLGSAVGQAFRGPQLTPQQKQMNTNFMKQYGVTRAPPTMGGRMVGGPFAGMNAPGTSAFGSKTSQEMAQKWALKNQHRQYTTPKMQQKQQNIINIATGGRDPGTGTTVTGHGKSGMGRDPSDRMARGGIAGLWPR
jgi:hypothetical protein